MKILCIGDIHIKPTNVHLVDLLEDQVVSAVKTQKITHVVLLGDILDTFERLHTQALNRAYQFIQNIRVHAVVYILVGNHDLINNQQFLTTQHWMNALKDWSNVIIVDTVISLESVLFVPYVPVGRFQEALETCSTLDWKSADYIFAHQEFKGCKMGAVVSVHGDDWLDSFPMVISGHIHDRQTPQDNIYYIGASIQNSFGDQSLPILLVIDVFTREFTEMPLELPRKKTVYLDIDKAHTIQPEQLLKETNLDTVRVVVKCDYEEFKVFTQTPEYDKLVSNPKCKIVHKPHKTEVVDTHEDLASIETNFHNNLFTKVLQLRDEHLYGAYMKIFHDTDIETKDILIV